MSGYLIIRCHTMCSPWCRYPVFTEAGEKALAMAGCEVRAVNRI